MGAAAAAKAEAEKRLATLEAAHQDHLAEVRREASACNLKLTRWRPPAVPPAAASELPRAASLGPAFNPCHPPPPPPPMRLALSRGVCALARAESARVR